MRRTVLSFCLVFSVLLMPYQFAASEEDFAQEIRQCYDDALSAVLESEIGIEKVTACSELRDAEVEAVEKASVDAFISSLQAFTKEQQRRILTALNQSAWETLVSDLFSDAVELKNDVAGTGHLTGDGQISLGLNLYGIWLLDRDQLCKREGRCVPCGQQAHDFLHNAIEGKSLTCQVATGSRDISVGLCRVDGKDLGLHLIKNGWAEVFDKIVAESPKLLGHYHEAFDTAKENRAGIHGMEYLEYYNRLAGERLTCEP